MLWVRVKVTDFGVPQSYIDNTHRSNILLFCGLGVKLPVSALVCIEIRLVKKNLGNDKGVQG